MDTRSPNRPTRSRHRARRHVALAALAATWIVVSAAHETLADDRDDASRLAPVVHARFQLSDAPRLLAPDSPDKRSEPRESSDPRESREHSASDAHDRSPTGRSPYDEWPERGMRAERDETAEREQLFPVQVAWINAAYGGQDYRGGEHVCAGCPLCIRRHAAPSDTGRYIGYYVGGGTALRGNGRYLDEGTWGWDYRGCIIEPRVILGWSHSRVQSGTGAYATDRRK